MIDENHQTNFVNDKMANMLGYSQEEMIGKTLFDFIYKLFAKYRVRLVSLFVGDKACNCG